MQTRIVSIFAAAAALGLVFACTVKTEAPDGSSSGRTRDGGSSSGSSGTSSGTSDGSTTGDPTVCKATENFDKCETCCGISDESVGPWDNTYALCVCDEKCKTECGSTYCAENGDDADQACNDCLDREEPGCITRADAECDKDAKCKPAVACANEACLEKLPDAGP